MGPIGFVLDVVIIAKGIRLTRKTKLLGQKAQKVLSELQPIKTDIFSKSKEIPADMRAQIETIAGEKLLTSPTLNSASMELFRGKCGEGKKSSLSLLQKYFTGLQGVEHRTVSLQDFSSLFVDGTAMNIKKYIERLPKAEAKKDLKILLDEIDKMVVQPTKDQQELRTTVLNLLYTIK